MAFNRLSSSARVVTRNCATGCTTGPASVAKRAARCSKWPSPAGNSNTQYRKRRHSASTGVWRRTAADSGDAGVIEAATEALAKGTEAFAAERMNHSIQKALSGKSVESL